MKTIEEIVEKAKTIADYAFPELRELKNKQHEYRRITILKLVDAIVRLETAEASRTLAFEGIAKMQQMLQKPPPPSTVKPSP